MTGRGVAAGCLVALMAAGCAAPRVRPPRHDEATPILRHTAPGRPMPPAVRAPVPPFRFVKEDLDGDSPKFVVTDARGMEWHAKLGPEAHADIAAARLIAAAGYFTEDAHYLPSIHVAGLTLHRGREYVDGHGSVRQVRMEPRPESVERGETWDWAANPFVGSLELDGLKVMMLLVNNYDARTANNHVLLARDPKGRLEARYTVTDLGASFGRYGGLGGTRTKLDPAGFAASRFVTGTDAGRVQFGFRTRPQGLGLTFFVLNPFYAAGELKKERDLQNVPVASVKWIASILRRLDERELRAIFDASGCDQATAASLTATLERRIGELLRASS